MSATGEPSPRVPISSSCVCTDSGKLTSPVFSNLSSKGNTGDSTGVPSWQKAAASESPTMVTHPLACLNFSARICARGGHQPSLFGS